MCNCLDDRVCGHHFEEIASLYRLLRMAEQDNTGMAGPLRLALAEYGSRVDPVILAVETQELT